MAKVHMTDRSVISADSATVTAKYVIITQGTTETAIPRKSVTAVENVG